MSVTGVMEERGNGGEATKETRTGIINQSIYLAYILIKSLHISLVPLSWEDMNM